MIVFKLPDLGEGLPDAIIREWYIKVGDTVKTDQPIVAMETAKALVDVPAASDGVVEKLFGDEGDTIETGAALIGFEGEGEEEAAKDSGTVVGAIEETGAVIQESAAGVGATTSTTAGQIKATPAVRALAKRLGVDLKSVAHTGERITTADVKTAAKNGVSAGTSEPISTAPDMQALSPARKAMVMSMTAAQDVTAVSLVDDADIHHWPAGTDVTVRLLRAIEAACKKEPLLNVTFDGKAMAYKNNDHINVGMAVDTPHGLFVPVIKDVNDRDDASLREQINAFKVHAQNKTFPREDLHGATIMLSNFGSLAGRYATPIVVPPMVAIVGIGRSRDEVVAVDGQVVIHKIMPISLTVDHRAITGGEAARFLKEFIIALQK